MKKTLALLLTLALVLGMIPGTAFAADATPLSAVVTINNGDTDVVYTGGTFTPDLAVTVNGVGVTGFNADWGGKTLKEAGTYDVTVTGQTSEGKDYKGTATFIIRAVDLTRATIMKTADFIDTDIDETDKTVLKQSVIDSHIIVMQDGEAITDYCDITSKVNGTSVRITASIKESALVANNVLKSSRVADYAIKTDIETGYTIDPIADQVYTGSEIKPAITVKTPTGGYFYQGSNYTVTYSNNVHAGAAANVTVSGIGSYVGTLNAQFTITQRPITSSDISITVADAAYKNGASVIPDVVVKHGTKVLNYGVDYMLSDFGTEKGTATVKVSGLGNYSGEVLKTYNIVDATKEILQNNVWIQIGGSNSASYMAYYNGQEQKPPITVYMGETKETATLLSPSYYNVEYSNNVKPGTTARIIITGKNGYAGTAFSHFTIMETELNNYNTNISGLSSSYYYDGSYHTPAVSVTTNGYALKKDVDYVVTYENNKNTSTEYYKAKVTVSAVPGSGYTGSAYAEFTIAGKSISACTASFTNGKNSSEYTGTAVIPAITVKEGAYTTLKAGTDYSVSYKDANGNVVATMKDAGTYSVVITGKGNYSGELVLYYSINGKSISGYTVTLNTNSVKANGLAQKPTITSVKNGIASLGTSDYTVSYQDETGKTVTSMIKPGNYKVIVTGKGAYSGSAAATFKIAGEKQNVTIAKTAYKVYKDTDPFKITATASGDGTGFTYESSNPEVASVDAKGVVTIHKLGRAKITVTTTGMTKYEAASEEVYVKVHPDKTVLTKKPWTEDKAGSLRVRWNTQEGVTKYQIRYSTTSDFKTYKTKTVTASELYDTQSTRITGLKSGTRYYVKVRAVKTVTIDSGAEQNYYGKWSNWKSRVTK